MHTKLPGGYVEHYIPVNHEAPDHDRIYCMTCDNRAASSNEEDE